MHEIACLKRLCLPREPIFTGSARVYKNEKKSTRITYFPSHTSRAHSHSAAYKLSNFAHFPLFHITECGTANQETRIVGGRPTGVNQYPWLARLVYDGQFHCGASLLTRDYVLTAAHCVRRFAARKSSWEF